MFATNFSLEKRIKKFWVAGIFLPAINATVFTQTVSCDDLLPRTHAHSHTQFSAARTSHARVRFAKVQIAHAPRTCAVVHVRFIKIRTRTRTFLAKN